MPGFRCIPLEYVGSYAYEGIFLHERFSVLADEGEPVYVRIDRYAQVCPCTEDGFAQGGQVLRKRLRVVGEVSCRFAVELDAFHTQSLEKLWHDDAADRVYGVQDDLEPSSGDGFLVHLFQRQDCIQVLVGIVLLRNLAKAVDPGEI